MPLSERPKAKNHFWEESNVNYLVRRDAGDYYSV